MVGFVVLLAGRIMEVMRFWKQVKRFEADWGMSWWFGSFF
jgi:hypothetical protein